MARNPKLIVDVDADTSGVQSGLSKSQAAVVGFSAAAGTALAGFAERAIRGAVNVGVAMVEQASQLQQSQGAIEAVFESQASAVEDYAKRAATAVGLSTSAYSNMAAVLGSQLRNAGVPMEELAGKTDELIRLGADLAATYGGTTADAVSAIGSLLRGERDPIDKYAVSINQATIEAWKLANGLDGATGEAKLAADQQATLALLFEKTAAAQGMFADESDTLAGAQSRLTATWEDAQAELGTALLPYMTAAANALQVFAQFAKENSDVLTILIGVLAATAAAVWLVNIAMAANPIGLIIAAIGLLIGIIVLLIANWDSVVAAFERGAQQIQDFFGGIGDFFADNWNSTIDALTRDWESFIGWIEDSINWLGDRIDDAIGWFNDLFNAGSRANSVPVNATAAAPATAGMFTAFAAASPAPATATSGAARSAAAATVRAQSRRSDGDGDTIINVNGALDPQAVSRQIAQLLRNRNARVGLAPAAGIRA